MGRQKDTKHPVRKKIYHFIIRFKKEHDGNSPSTREITEACEISSTSVTNYHLGMLEEDGLLKLNFNTPRMIEVTGGEWMMHSEYLDPELQIDKP